MAQTKKLSVATVYGKIKLSELIKAKTIHLMDVMGVAVREKKGLSSFGEWSALEGRFRATNAATGEVNESSTLFLPDVALTPIQVALSAPDAKGVEFAISISAKYVAEDEGHKAGGSPYEYTWEPILSMGSDDPLARISAKIEAQKLALAGPKVESTSTAETPSESAKPTSPAVKKAGK